MLKIPVVWKEAARSLPWWLRSSTTGKQCKVILVVTFAFDQFNKFEFTSNGKTQLSLWKGNPFLFGDNWTMCKRLLCNLFHMYISTQLGVGCINLSEPKGIKICKKIATPCEGTRSIRLLPSLDPPRDGMGLRHGVALVQSKVVQRLSVTIQSTTMTSRRYHGW